MLQANFPIFQPTEGIDGAMGKLEGQNKGTEQESGLHQGSQPQDGAQAEPPLTLKQIVGLCSRAHGLIEALPVMKR